MRDQITESISTYHFNLDVEAKQEFAFSIIIDSLDRKKYSDASDKDEKFESLIIEKAELWEDYFQKYLYSCIEKMKLNKIEMPEGSRARAIDIYENMNMGGLSLSTLDLVAARVAKVPCASHHAASVNPLCLHSVTSSIQSSKERLGARLSLIMKPPNVVNFYFLSKKWSKNLSSIIMS